ncbi:choice-of-anchor P family protein [Microlunatus capsulatus]|uniref:Uncharacterized protein n=1 Tax=Microlunatus capsulatus TaxID=99117 RepID=A0ABS4ZDN7_9ACTN|nr:choice-of-anchor P family protein [Microlunatus capsulatus]MBP2419106.1 hypothetical protein [Microlunatus capsulatus]
MSSLSTRGLGAAATVALTAAAVLGLPTSAPAATTTASAAGGSAYGSTVKVGNLVDSGRTSYVPLCTTRVGSAANNTARVDLGLLGHIGAATTKVVSTDARGTRAATATSTTAGTSLLGGLVSVSSITSTAGVSKDARGYHSTGSSVLVGLRVAGRSVTAKPAPGTSITIPGVATVLLNQQSARTSAGAHNQGVTALRVTLLPGNTLGLPTGTVVVGAANASLAAPTRHRPYGSAFGTEANVAGLVGSGRTASSVLPCGGSGGVTRTNKVASVTAPGLVRVGAVTSSAKSTDTASATTATTAAKVAGISLLGGVVEVDAVTAQANAKRTATGVARTSTGTQVVGLKINGRARTVSTKENTTIDIAGVGTLTLHKTARTATSITVDALQLRLTTARAGLPVGAVVTLGHAGAGVAHR